MYFLECEATRKSLPDVQYFHLKHEDFLCFVNLTTLQQQQQECYN